MEQNLWFRFLMVFVIFALVSNCGRLAAMNNFELLHGSLRSFQSHACDGEELRLSCTNDTVIVINSFFYGRHEKKERLCHKAYSYAMEPCKISKALEVIERLCHGQVLCRLYISPDTFHADPCPRTSKYAEVVYKCRPENFRNKIVCEDERLELSCRPGESLVIYSATYGSTKGDIPECPQEFGVREDCEVSNATQKVIERCVGEQKCTIVADVKTFGNSQCTGQKYLKVAYTCVSAEIVIAAAPGFTSEEEMIHTTSFPAWARGLDPSLAVNNRTRGNPTRHPTDPSNLFKSEMQSDEVPSSNTDEKPFRKKKLVGFMSEWMSAKKYMEGNKNKLILYVSVSLAVGFLFFVSVLVGHLLLKSKLKRNRNEKLPPAPEDPFFSDSDLEQFDPPDEHIPAVKYTASIRRHDSDAQPRALVKTNDDRYFS